MDVITRLGPVDPKAVETAVKDHNKYLALWKERKVSYSFISIIIMIVVTVIQNDQTIRIKIICLYHLHLLFIRIILEKCNRVVGNDRRGHG